MLFWLLFIDFYHLCRSIPVLQLAFRKKPTTTVLTPSFISFKNASSSSTKETQQTKKSSSLSFSSFISKCATWKKISTWNPKAPSPSMNSSSFSTTSPLPIHLPNPLVITNPKHHSLHNLSSRSLLYQKLRFKRKRARSGLRRNQLNFNPTRLRPSKRHRLWELSIKTHRKAINLNSKELPTILETLGHSM